MIQKVQGKPGDTCEVKFKSGSPTVNIWLCKPLCYELVPPLYVIEGNVISQGYLPVVVSINGQQVYPRKRSFCASPGTMVTIEVSGVLPGDFSEVYDCDSASIKRIRIDRLLLAIKLAGNPEKRAELRAELAELQAPSR